MKHLLLAAFFIFSMQYLKAQFYKGEKLLGGNFQVTNNFSSPIIYGPNIFVGDEDKTFSIGVTPQIVHFFRDNKAIGIQAGIHHYDSKQGPMESKSNGYDFGLFFKEYKFFYKGLALAYSLGTNYAMTTQEGNGSKYKTTLASLQLSPYVAYRFSGRFSLESSLGKAGVGKSVSKDEVNNITRKRTDYFVGVLNGFNLSAYYVFGNKKESN